MREPKHIDCEMCAIRSICFPGRIATDTQGHSNVVRIRRAHVAQNHVLYRCGDQARSFYMLRSGCMKEIDCSGAEHSSVANFCLPGELLSLHSAGDKRLSSTSIAIEGTSYCEMRWHDFYQVCVEAPDVVAEFIRLLAKSSAASLELINMIRRKEALERVAGFLLNISDRLQFRGLHKREFKLSMSRADIATYLGLTNETVSRCMSELARRELIHVQAKRIQLLHVTDLQQLYSSG